MITIPNTNNLVYGLSLDWNLVTIVNSITFMARYRQAMFIPAGSLSNYLCALFFQSRWEFLEFITRHALHSQAYPLPGYGDEDMTKLKETPVELVRYSAVLEELADKGTDH